MPTPSPVSPGETRVTIVAGAQTFVSHGQGPDRPDWVQFTRNQEPALAWVGFSLDRPRTFTVAVVADQAPPAA